LKNASLAYTKYNVVRSSYSIVSGWLRAIENTKEDTTMKWVRIGIAVATTIGLACAQAPEFDAASIKPSKVEGRNGPVRFEPGRVFSDNVHVFRMILAAYHLEEYQLERRPDWLDSENFALEAKAATPVDENQLRLMLKTLLRNRFKLVVHYETKDIPVYALVIGKNGTKLREWKPGDPVPTRNGGGSEHSVSALSHQTLESFVAQLNLSGFNATYGIGRPVLDMTGLKGTYLFNYWCDSPEDFRIGVIEDQLGLKLESRRAPVDVLVIDHIEKPSEN
jgi:uncharacterized protein (TIGR03435 family)